MNSSAISRPRSRLRPTGRRKAIGLYAIALSAGAVTGQILGGLLISADLAGTQWRAIFMINVPIGLVGLIVAARFLPADGTRACRPLDLVGMAVLSASILLVALPLTLGREEGWPVWTWVCLVASLGTLYLEIAGNGTGFSGAAHAFAITTAALAGVALVAACLSVGATYGSRDSSLAEAAVLERGSWSLSMRTSLRSWAVALR